jgi:hypothetical protein
VLGLDARLQVGVLAIRELGELEQVVAPLRQPVPGSQLLAQAVGLAKDALCLARVVPEVRL